MSWIDTLIPVVVIVFLIFLLYKPFAPLIKGFWGGIIGGLARFRKEGEPRNTTKTINYE